MLKGKCLLKRGEDNFTNGKSSSCERGGVTLTIYRYFLLLAFEYEAQEVQGIQKDRKKN